MANGRGRGRPTKFTSTTISRLVHAIKLGATYDLACKYANIDYSLFALWMNGRHFPKGTTQQQKDDFVETIRAAEGEAAMVWLAKIERAASDGNWTAAAWKLERRYPNQYGRAVISHKVSAEVDEQAALLAQKLGLSKDELLAEAGKDD